MPPLRGHGLKYVEVGRIVDPDRDAPIAGAWVEIRVLADAGLLQRPMPPLRGHGLKFELRRDEPPDILDAPIAGAWVEIW